MTCDIIKEENDEINGSQIWKSDGTNDGTVMVTSNPQTTFYGNQLIKYNNLLFLSIFFNSKIKSLFFYT